MEHYMNPGNISYISLPGKLIQVYGHNSSHDFKPFLLMTAMQDNVQGFYLTSNLNIYAIPDNLKHILGCGKYNLSSNSLVEINNPITMEKENYIMSMRYYKDTIDDNDFGAIRKKSSIYSNMPIDSTASQQIINTGDIIAYHGQLYLIYGKDSVNCYGMLINKISSPEEIDAEHPLNYTNINGTIYNVDFNGLQILRNTDTLMIVDMTSKEKVADVLKNRKECKYQIKHQNDKKKKRR